KRPTPARYTTNASTTDPAASHFRNRAIACLPRVQSVPARRRRARSKTGMPVQGLRESSGRDRRWDLARWPARRAGANRRPMHRARAPRGLASTPEIRASAVDRRADAARPARMLVFLLGLALLIGWTGSTAPAFAADPTPPNEPAAAATDAGSAPAAAPA